MAGEDLGLAVKRQVLGILGHDHVSDQRLGRQPGLDQLRRRRGLGHASASLRAGVTRADGDDHPQLGRRDIEPLAAILADLDHGPAAAGASDACRFDHPLDVRQLFGQGAGTALRTFDIGLIGRPGSASDGLLDFCDRDLDILKDQLPLIRIELLRSWAKPCPAQFVHQVLKAQIGFFEKGVLSCEVGLLRHELRRLQFETPPCRALLIERAGRLGKRLGLRLECRSHISRQTIETSRINGVDHARSVNDPRQCDHANPQDDLICRSGHLHQRHSDASPVEALEQRFELRPRQSHHAVANLRPAELPVLQSLVGQHQAGTVPHQNSSPGRHVWSGKPPSPQSADQAPVRSVTVAARPS